jgi:hypothetical protein
MCFERFPCRAFLRDSCELAVFWTFGCDKNSLHRLKTTAASASTSSVCVLASPTAREWDQNRSTEIIPRLNAAVAAAMSTAAQSGLRLGQTDGQARCRQTASHKEVGHDQCGAHGLQPCLLRLCIGCDD